jgi:hypothetical protein
MARSTGSEPSLRIACFFVWVVTLTWSLSPPLVFGQAVTEPSLKAAFIFNFAKFTEWPVEVLPASGPFVACVLGDDAVGAALERAVKGRLLGDHIMKVSRVEAGGPLQSCHLLYLAAMPGSQLTQAITSTRGLPVLTISDVDEFATMGGIAHMFVESGTMRFNLNFGVAKRSRLLLSSKLLSLANRVLDEGAGPQH